MNGLFIEWYENVIKYESFSTLYLAECFNSGFKFYYGYKQNLWKTMKNDYLNK